MVDRAPDDPWPDCGHYGRPLQLFLQLDLGGLPAELGQRFGSGLLQLFYCTRGPCQGFGGWEPFAADLSRVRVIPSSLETALKIWRSVMPQREMVVEDNKVFARLPGQKSYICKEMSEGERVALYLISQSLSAPGGAIVVIDEPELHLHQAIQAPLWDAIEAARPDRIFVYITHDLAFNAAEPVGRGKRSRRHADEFAGERAGDGATGEDLGDRTNLPTPAGAGAAIVQQGPLLRPP